MRPILYSFRRCPYAMRARLAIASSGVQVALREILLRDKPDAFLRASPSATVPCLVTENGVIDESLDVMKWALGQSDPERLLDMPDAGTAWIDRFDGPFKYALDRTKYAVRYPENDPEDSREAAMAILADLERQFDGAVWIFGDQPRLADLAILPFVRQFAMIDKARFDREAPLAVGRWLAQFMNGTRLATIMKKYPVWSAGQEVILFPER